MSEKSIRCVICYNEFSVDEIQGATCCPSCGSKGIPCNIEDDVSVKLNWHELRILCCWAERWALNIEKEATSATVTLDCIVQRLQKQHPTKTPLTVRGEVSQLPDKFQAELTDGDGTPIDV